MGQPIREHCEETGTSFPKLATLCETTEVSLSRIDRGKQWPGRGILTQLRRHTGLSADVLLGFEPYPKKSDAKTEEQGAAEAPALAGDCAGAQP